MLHSSKKNTPSNNQGEPQKPSKKSCNSSIFSEETYTLKVRRPEVKTSEDYVGPLVFPDNVVGKMVAWLTPGAKKIDVDKLRFVVSNYQDYKTLAERYRDAIQTSPFVQWTLIPYLLGANSGLAPLSDTFKSQIRNNKDFFRFLVQEGAKYKHFLAGAYGIPSLEGFKFLLDTLGAEASIPEKDTLSLLQLSLTSHYSETAFDKVKALLLAGVDINAQVDEEYENTILHYVIALEHHTSITIQLIDFIETPQCHYNYTLQDKYGKTPLLLAVGLNATKVVDKLLKQALGKNKKDIGLNTPDIQGRTPCMIAAALGHRNLLEQLIKAGANCYLTDIQGRDLLWYANAPMDEVRKILQSCSVHPDRIASVNNSYLYSSTREAYPAILVNKQTQEEHLLLLSREEPHFSLLKIALQTSLKTPDPELSHLFFKQQTESFLTKPGESMSQVALKNQVETKRYVQETLFRFACAFGDLEKVEKIGAEKDFSFTNCDHLARTPLHYAVMTKNLLQGLIKSTGYSRSAEECLKNHCKIFDYLINENSTLLDSKNANGNTPADLLRRDSNSDDVDTREQAQMMLHQLEAHHLSSNMKRL